MSENDHKKFMQEALNESQKAAKENEVPVGAVLILNDKVIARAHNLTIKLNDPTAHAEILVLRKAAKKLGNYRLNNTTLYVTVEPCPMCAGAMVWARVGTLVYGAKDIKSGACGSVMNICNNRKLNHRIKVVSGILESECKKIIQSFFRFRRS